MKCFSVMDLFLFCLVWGFFFWGGGEGVFNGGFRIFTCCCGGANHPACAIVPAQYTLSLSSFWH